MRWFGLSVLASATVVAVSMGSGCAHASTLADDPGDDDDSSAQMMMPTADAGAVKDSGKRHKDSGSGGPAGSMAGDDDSTTSPGDDDGGNVMIGTPDASGDDDGGASGAMDSGNGATDAGDDTGTMDSGSGAMDSGSGSDSGGGMDSGSGTDSGSGMDSGSDSGSGADAGSDSGTSPACTPSALDGFATSFHHGRDSSSCTSSSINTAWTACLSSGWSQSACDAFKSAHSTCAACLFSQSTDNKWGPIVVFPTGRMSVDLGGCIDDDSLFSDVSACTTDLEAVQECYHYACDSACVGSSDADYAACVAAAKAGACKTYVDKANSNDCSIPAIVADDCGGTASTMETQFKDIAATLCLNTGF